MTADVEAIKLVITDMVKDYVSPPFKWVTRSQAAEYLGLTEHGVDRLAKFGKKAPEKHYTIEKNTSGMLCWADICLIKQKFYK